MSLPETWDELRPLIRPQWVDCLAWAVGGGDPDGLDIRVRGGRAIYTNAWCFFPHGRERVHLAYVATGGPRGLREVGRNVDPDTVLQVRRMETP